MEEENSIAGVDEVEDGSVEGGEEIEQVGEDVDVQDEVQQDAQDDVVEDNEDDAGEAVENAEGEESNQEVQEGAEGEVANVESNNGIDEEEEKEDEEEVVGQQNGDVAKIESDEPEQQRKLFLGGLNYETNEEDLKGHFSTFGTVVDCVVMRDQKTKKSRCFGFVTYANKSEVDKCMASRPHQVKGRSVEPKRALPREVGGRKIADRPGQQACSQKAFVGGLKDEITEDDLREYFAQYGKITNITIVVDKSTGKRKGFGFVEYDDYDPVDKALQIAEHIIKGCKLNVEKALSPDKQDERGGRRESRSIQRMRRDGSPGRDFRRGPMRGRDRDDRRRFERRRDDRPYSRKPVAREDRRSGMRDRDSYRRDDYPQMYQPPSAYPPAPYPSYGGYGGSYSARDGGALPYGTRDAYSAPSYGQGPPRNDRHGDRRPPYPDGPQR